jgi:GT2 family glycosyltransferase
MDQIEIRRDLEKSIINSYQDVEKDIIIIVKDGYEYIKNCIDSIKLNTDKYHLYIWDNNSQPQTRDYLQDLVSDNIHIYRSNANLGFIVPNNKLVELSFSPYVILLNSDTVVMPMWSRGLTSVLQLMPKIGAVGYGGGVVNEDCIGVQAAYGTEIDFVQGYCLALRRDTYEKFGLFDDTNLRFAYGEDSDFCFRLKEAGMICYAISLELLWHKGGATSANVMEEVRPAFNANHNYLKKRWKKYLDQERMLIKHNVTTN